MGGVIGKATTWIKSKKLPKFCPNFTTQPVEVRLNRKVWDKFSFFVDISLHLPWCYDVMVL